jgi:hypothetical protein
MPQLAALTLLYQVFEGVLFNWIGNDRDKNIFCVPWSETQLSYRTVQRLADSDYFPMQDWQKYTALNLKPVLAQGSIEWRHMEGNCDIGRILMWCRFIGHMYRYVRQSDMQRVQDVFTNLNTTSQYLNVLIQVFQDDHTSLLRGNYEKLLEDGVLEMKYSLINPNNVKKKAPMPKGKSMFTPAAINRLLDENPMGAGLDWAALRRVNDERALQARIAAINAGIRPAERVPGAPGAQAPMRDVWPGVQPAPQIHDDAFIMERNPE